MRNSPGSEYYPDLLLAREPLRNPYVPCFYFMKYRYPRLRHQYAFIKTLYRLRLIPASPACSVPPPHPVSALPPLTMSPIRSPRPISRLRPSIAAPSTRLFHRSRVGRATLGKPRWAEQGSRRRVEETIQIMAVGRIWVLPRVSGGDDHRSWRHADHLWKVDVVSDWIPFCQY